MFSARRVKKQKKWLRMLSRVLGAIVGLGPCLPAIADKGGAHGTATPIQHVIVIVGENRTFDNVFGGYQPSHGQSVMNLLSEGIINADGTRGPNFGKAAQWQASDTSTYSISPDKTSQFSTLPQPNTTYAFGQPLDAPDARFPSDLPNGPFQISKYTAYQGAFTGDPVHRFFQMWQDYDEGKMDLFTWVGVTIGTGSNGNPQPSPFTDQTTGQGGVAMGFFNMSQGDAPVFKFIADNYGISDNYHQAIMGGTGANFIFLGTADEGFYTDSNGNPATPPANQIENPNPQSGTNNWYTQDGYSGGSYVNCANSSQPGVSPIRDYLASLSVNPNCESGHYYLVNNYGPAYKANGQLVDTSTHPFTLPPQNLPNLAQALSDANVSWKYYIGGYNGGDANDSSIIKFIEKNWGLGALSSRSRDNLPNPVVSGSNPYVPINGPAIGDLMNLFDFTHKRNSNDAPLIIPGGV